MKASQEIHDMIQCFDLGASSERVASQLLDIAAALNRRMDEIEAANQRTANIASCLANGIQPD